VLLAVSCTGKGVETILNNIQMEKFTDKQNEVFSGIFDALKQKGANFETQAHTLIDLDDDNFKKVFKESKIIGSDYEVGKVYHRAKQLGVL
jgi:hypothetical protein